MNRELYANDGTSKLSPAEKLAALAEHIHTDGEAYYISDANNRRCFTSFRSTGGVLIVSKKKPVFFTDSRYYESALKKLGNIEVILMRELPKQLPEVLKGMGINTICFEASKTTVKSMRKYQNMLKGFELRFEDGLDDCIDMFRSIKTPDEIDKIKYAQSIAQKSYEEILNHIKPGVSEKQLCAELNALIYRYGAEDIAFPTILLSGENTSMPHGVPSGRTLKNGDFVTLDFGAVYDGYHSDMTRTVALGSVSQEQKNVYDTVLRAQLAAIKGIKAGVLCSAPDHAARSVIEAEGYGEFFGHGTGHGVGLEVHESPLLSPRANDALKAGQVVTAEPGIYLPGRFGVRIEDMLEVTEDGSRNLTEISKELTII